MKTMKKNYQAPSTKVHFGGLETAGSLLTASQDIANPSDKTMDAVSARSKQWRTDESYQIWD